ncbi:MAG: DUF2782 domain-containing protein [Azoarcus sp.]|jgi:hypothetical protein|nr:DUF2782 domain-containing protein [Azoarcus sp.]
MRRFPPVSALLCAGLLLLIAPALAAQEPPALEPLEEEIPEVTVIQRGEDLISEYRLRNRLYMVKVAPRHSAPYYLVDREGKGRMVREEVAPSLTVPSWIVTTW